MVACFRKTVLALEVPEVVWLGPHPENTRSIPSFHLEYGVINSLILYCYSCRVWLSSYVYIKV